MTDRSDVVHSSLGALSGVTVADFSHVLAGPLCSQTLGDLGADVIKVERLEGDGTRQWGPPFFGETAVYYYSANRNKRSVVLDLANERDQQRARVLVSRSDVVVENLRPGTLSKFGLDYESVCERNERLIYCSITGFGRGDGVALPGYDFLLQACGGLMSITGNADGSPVKVGVAVIDQFAGLYAAVGILAALHERGRSGRGQRIEISLIEAALSMLGNQGLNYLLGGGVPGPMGDRHPNAAPYQLFDTADRPFAVAAVNDRFFRLLCESLGMSHMADDPLFLTNSDRVENRAELERRLAKVFLTRPADYWMKVLGDHGVPCALLNDVPAALEYAQGLGLDMVETVSDGDRPLQLLRNPLSLSRTPATTRLAPPALGMHQDEVISQLDRWLSEEEAEIARSGGHP